MWQQGMCVPGATVRLCRSNLCDMLSLHPDCVNIKAKTHEKVDSLGEERSIACHTVILLVRE